MNGGEAVRASAVAVGASGLLILGATGRGKSSLALALIARGAELIADDQVLLSGGGNDAPTLSPPDPIAGLVEARGLGLLRLPCRRGVPLALIADLDRAPAGRLPPLATRPLRGHAVPVLLCRDRPGLADALIVLLRHGRLVDPDRHRAGG